MTVLNSTSGPLAGSRRETIRVAGPSGREVPIDVVGLGQGPTTVFLHGLVGLNAHWEGVVGRVASRLRCVLVQVPLLDLRGSDCSVHAVSEMTAKALDAVADQLGGPAVMVGNSFGGHVACRLGIERPDLVRGLVLTGSSGLFERPLAETQRMREIQIRPSKEWVAEKIGELFYDRSNIREGDLERAHAELNRRGGARAMVRLSRSARKNNLADDLGEIQAPTLLIWGREDIVTPPEAAQEFLDRLPNARIEWFDRCGHVPMLEHPDEFAAALTSFALEQSGNGAG
ncbi:MAG: alpha/beta hydrolase [Planctomycetota bacterium]